MNTAWAQLISQIETCENCALCTGRTHAVPGEGHPHARLMLIGEGPGAEEDLSGRPFVGAAGRLLTDMLHAIGLERTEVYIANIVKCRPPGNRAPAPEEAAQCLPYLRAQVKLIRPQVILLLGATAARHTLDPDIRITRDRGKWALKAGVWMLPTFHPAALLRDASYKRPAWQDMQSVRDKLKELAAEGGGDGKLPDQEGVHGAEQV